MSDPSALPPRLARLAAHLREEIAARGRIPFRDYMDAALYAPDLGYYSSGAVSLGRGGDFVTSPEVDPAFGRMLARWLARVDAALGRPALFVAVEAGAGTGRLAADILAALHSEQPDLFSRVQYRIIERSPALRAQQQALLAGIPGATLDWVEDITALAPGSVTGAIFSNELLDAFPVHRVIQTDAGLQESYVGLDPAGQFREEIGPLSTPALATYFARLGITLPPGARGEVNLAAVDWLQRAAVALDRGALLTIDYGDTADRLYSALRPDGTLLCYTQGRVTDDPFAAPGAQDMTAHVDFTTLQQAGAEAGLTTVALTRQMAFLVDLGLGDLLAGLTDQYQAAAASMGAAAAGAALLTDRARLFRLLNPDGLGRFHILVQGKNFEF